MFNIFEKHGEGMEEDAKIRFLFKNVQHSGLQSDIAALKASITTSAVGTIFHIPQFVIILALQSRNYQNLSQKEGTLVESSLTQDLSLSTRLMDP